MGGLDDTGVCDKNDRRYIELYKAIAILGRKIQVGMHIALYCYLSRRSFFSQTPVAFGLGNSFWSTGMGGALTKYLLSALISDL